MFYLNKKICSNLGYDLINLQIIDTLRIFKSIQSISHVNLDNMFILGITHGGKIALTIIVSALVLLAAGNWAWKKYFSNKKEISQEK